VVAGVRTDQAPAPLAAHQTAVEDGRQEHHDTEEADPRRREAAVALGCVLAAVGFLLAGEVTALDFGTQQWYVTLAGDAHARDDGRGEPGRSPIVR